MTTITRQYLSVQEVSEYTGLKRSVIYQALQAGELKAGRSGAKPKAKYLIKQSHVDAWLERNNR